MSHIETLCLLKAFSKGPCIKYTIEAPIKNFVSTGEKLPNLAMLDDFFFSIPYVPYLGFYETEFA